MRSCRDAIDVWQHSASSPSHRTDRASAVHRHRYYLSRLGLCWNLFTNIAHNSISYCRSMGVFERVATSGALVAPTPEIWPIIAGLARASCDSTSGKVLCVVDDARKFQLSDVVLRRTPSIRFYGGRDDVGRRTLHRVQAKQALAAGRRVTPVCCLPEEIAAGCE